MKGLTVGSSNFASTSSLFIHPYSFVAELSARGLIFQISIWFEYGCSSRLFSLPGNFPLPNVEFIASSIFDRCNSTFTFSAEKPGLMLTYSLGGDLCLTLSLELLRYFITKSLRCFLALGVNALCFLGWLSSVFDLFSKAQVPMSASFVFRLAFSLGLASFLSTVIPSPKLRSSLRE